MVTYCVGVEDLSSLRELTLVNTKVDDFSVLNRLTKLEYLDLSESDFDDRR